MKKKLSNRGFSLIEIVISIIIFATGVIAIINFIPTLSRSSHRSAIATEKSMLVKHAILKLKNYAALYTWDEFDLNFKDDWKILTPTVRYQYKIGGPSESVGFDDHLRKVTLILRTYMSGWPRDTRFYTYISR